MKSQLCIKRWNLVTQALISVPGFVHFYLVFYLSVDLWILLRSVRVLSKGLNQTFCCCWFYRNVYALSNGKMKFDLIFQQRLTNQKNVERRNCGWCVIRAANQTRLPDRLTTWRFRKPFIHNVHACKKHFLLFNQ